MLCADAVDWRKYARAWDEKKNAVLISLLARSIVRAQIGVLNLDKCGGGGEPKGGVAAFV